MDALTTSSAGRETGPGDGRSGDPNAAPRPENQGDWGWFRPTKPQSDAEPHARAADGDAPGAAPESPSRQPTTIRPVGTGADRGRTSPPTPLPAPAQSTAPPFQWPPAGSDRDPAETHQYPSSAHVPQPREATSSGVQPPTQPSPGDSRGDWRRQDAPTGGRVRPPMESTFPETAPPPPADRGSGDGLPPGWPGRVGEPGTDTRPERPQGAVRQPRWERVTGPGGAAGADRPGAGEQPGAQPPAAPPHATTEYPRPAMDPTPSGGYAHERGPVGGDFGRPPAAPTLPRRDAAERRPDEADFGRGSTDSGSTDSGLPRREAGQAQAAATAAAADLGGGSWFDAAPPQRTDAPHRTDTSPQVPQAPVQPGAAASAPPRADGSQQPAPRQAQAAPPRDAQPPATERQAPSAAASAQAGSPDAVLIRRTMAVIEPIADKTTSYFYALLFLQHPELRELFPAAMDAQRDRLFKALLTAAKHVDDADTLTEYLSNLGRGHRKYGTQPEHYPAVGECLIGALTRYAGDLWNEEVEAAWVRAYTAISQIMIDAAAVDQRKSPPWWQAEIVSHERRTADIAVVTVRPDQPYAFVAGQYTSLETPWWPRVWRHYSFASAPRTDGLLSFHVKAVPAGWVSSAIVNRARPGDVIRLGPPAGSMIVDHGTDNGLLCLGGGTGIAPIKALVEDVAEHGRRRSVEVFYGARSGHDLYDLDTMLRLQQEHPWLSVRPVVAEGPAGQLTGQLPEIVRQHGPWHAYDAYLSGPPGMIRSSVDALVGVGMPAHRIRHDSVEDLVSVGD